MFYSDTSTLIEEHIKKSHFIGVLVPCANENEVFVELKKLHEQYSDATHIAYAYRLKTNQGIIYRFHDAGEPTGTAGKPIYQHLEGKNIIDVLVAVIRYFGGIKLGAGGLTRAYSQTANLVISATALKPYIEFAELTLTLDYKQLQLVDYSLKKLHGQIVQQVFTEQVLITVRLPADNVETLQKALA